MDLVPIQIPCSLDVFHLAETSIINVSGIVMVPIIMLGIEYRGDCFPRSGISDFRDTVALKANPGHGTEIAARNVVGRRGNTVG
ncbi:hypothetical protein P691DRAFT_810418 [Macrolepiota fuliginosa MF-IS2]|uniref:Uncharacterized protein n=1 Tax=Macrolepiota fuliginosa MF-IS2 TaxID=1400762 RepID=A0A9P5X1J6_9AGAR|nr:hypothetical protein P691DRAFT_810418 [Macrolepiota fuliginosa MF-IS2]